MGAWCDQSLDQRVQGIGCIVGENDPIRIASSEELADLTSDARHPLFGLHGKIVTSSARGDSQAGISIDHLFQDFPRFGKGRGRVIEIDCLSRDCHRLLTAGFWIRQAGQPAGAIFNPTWEKGLHLH